MDFSKPAISIPDQIIKLAERGLTINNYALAFSFLSCTSYYRLRAYTYPFQDNTNQDHPFIKEVTFEEIIELYHFDSKLRHLVFEAIEKIEVAFRTQLINYWGVIHGSHWQLQPNLYRNLDAFKRQIIKLETEIDHSKENFIDHYREKYSSPLVPPSWMCIEISSFGLLSQMFRNLKKGEEKKAVIKYFGLNDISVLENWMHSFNNIRNICAHHGRLWNRRFTNNMRFPTNTQNQFVEIRDIHPNKLYGVICSMEYILRIISPGNTLQNNLITLINTCPLAQEKEMGFPLDWQEDKFWKI